MLHTLALGLLAAAFLGAGVFNAAGSRATRASFERWGYPRHWHRVTGALEILCAALIALPATYHAGMMLGTGIVVVALLTVLWQREYAHLAPLGGFIALIALVALS